MLGPARKLGASVISAEGVNNNDTAVGNPVAAVSSDKAQGRQRAVNQEPESGPAPASQLDTQAYPHLTSDIQAPTPSTQAEIQWAQQEAEKAYARQAQDDPAWTDDEGSEIEEDDDLVCIGSKRHSPTPELPSAGPLKKVRSNDRRESCRSRTRRYGTLTSPKSIRKRDELLAAIIRNWTDIRLAIPEHIGPRHISGKSNDNVPAQPQDWATRTLEAAKVLSEKTKGDPNSAQRALRRVVAMPGREWSWTAHREDFYVAARLVDQDITQGPKSPSVQLSEDLGSRLFVTPTPDAAMIDDEPSEEADAVVDNHREHKSLEDLLLALREATTREVCAKQRKQDLSEGAYDEERGQELLKAWKGEEDARIQREALEEEIKTLIAAS